VSGTPGRHRALNRASTIYFGNDVRLAPAHDVLGLRGKHVDLAKGELKVRRSRLRPKYAHGCGETCGRKAGYCPERVQVNDDDAPTKSRAGERGMGLPDELIGRKDAVSAA
jgi:hypothetical protein